MCLARRRSFGGSTHRSAMANKMHMMPREPSASYWSRGSRHRCFRSLLTITHHHHHRPSPLTAAPPHAPAHPHLTHPQAKCNDGTLARVWPAPFCDTLRVQLFITHSSYVIPPGYGHLGVHWRVCLGPQSTSVRGHAPVAGREGVCVYACMFTCMCMCVCARMYACVYACACIYMCVLRL